MAESSDYEVRPDESSKASTKLLGIDLAKSGGWEQQIVQSQVEAPPEVDEERIGVCFSGGGIRSASVAMGALQALQEGGIVGPPGGARFLSAVSGGGYLAGAYEMTRSRGVFASPPGTAGTQAPPLAAGTPEEEWIRKRSAFLSYSMRQKMRLLGRLILGISVNAALVFLGLFVILRPVGWFLYEVMTPGFVTDGGIHFTLSPAHWIAILLPLGLAFLSGLLSLTSMITNDDNRYEQWLLFVAAMMWVATTAFVVLVVLPFSVWLFYDRLPALLPEFLTVDRVGQDEPTGLLALFAAGGAFAFITTAVRKQLAAVEPTWWGVIATALVVPLLLLWALSAVVHGALVHGVAGHASPLGMITFPEPALWLALTVVLALVWLVSDQRSWSMHPFYKRRLAHAFAVERVEDRAAREIPWGQVTDFLGREELDQRGIAGPCFISCAAANIYDTAKAAPSLRAAPFIFSGDRIGSPHPEIKEMDAKVYRDRLDSKVRRRDVTVPAALAISGAALSPAMGKRSRWWLTSFLAIANVRLGVWLPNPQWMGSLVDSDLDDPWFERPRLSYLFKEIFAIHSIRDRFLYVTDGGHFDNLGLVELLRRSCTTIYVIDGSGAEPGVFTTLGEAMALAMAEFGVRFDINLHEMRPLDADAAAGYVEAQLMLPWRRRRTLEARGGVLLSRPYAWGKFTYRMDENGVERKGNICYIQTGVTASTPWQVRSHWEADARFPNDSTINQNFDHQQFEAYRALGFWAAEQALANDPTREVAPAEGESGSGLDA
ncbi:MAG TPA: hypothetical protein VJA46_00450 [Acidimicrobiia bacterium]|nr:hypothetical protein [Acidimicrobiia bacterium]